MHIRPITDLRNTTEISEICNSTGEPVFITKNGYGDLVVMSLAAYERDIAKARLHASLMEGIRQVNACEYRDADELLAELRLKYAGK
ncbi:MAG: type II toxin-antitoxin system Phd/YefM family antitoxin [Firmicutes bacterium]|nr:type II toxin-antitoxin system Phd/YefM family antitoxin [Bacillota bacterium]